MTIIIAASFLMWMVAAWTIMEARKASQDQATQMRFRGIVALLFVLVGHIIKLAAR